MNPLNALLMASTAVGVGGSLFKSFRSSSVGKLQSSIARQNTELLLKSAEAQDGMVDFANARSNFEATRIRDAVRKVAGAQVTHWASNNLDPTKGSPALIAMQTAAQGEADVGLALAQGWLDVADIRTRQANMYGDVATSSWQEAQIKERAFENRMAGYFGAAGTLLMSARAWPGLREGRSATSSSYDIGSVPYAPDDL